jgi:hypothetical protein
MIMNRMQRRRRDCTDRNHHSYKKKAFMHSHSQPDGQSKQNNDARWIDLAAESSVYLHSASLDEQSLLNATSLIANCHFLLKSCAP